MTGPAILVEGLSKLYRRASPGHHFRTLKSALVDRSLVEGLKPEEAIAALADISFSVERGEAFGLIGGNGSGKSTLLKIVAGILRPSRGRVVVDGRVSVIELGAGFHPEISGRENVYINGAVLGSTRAQVDARYDDIVEFSGLGDFMEEPVKNYSSGMYVRLGFAVAVHTDPDVLLVDEVLSVGDEAFAHRGLRRIEEMLAQGRTLLLVSHSLGLMESLCDRLLWLDRGVPRLLGEPRRVIDAYRLAVAEEEGREHKRDQENQREQNDPVGSGENPLRWGSRQAEITAARLLAMSGEERYVFTSGESMTIEIEAQASTALTDFVFGVAIATPRGVECWGTNTEVAGFKARSFSGSARVRVVLPALRLAAGEYHLDVAVHARDGKPYDYRRQLLAFTVTEERPGVGVYAPEHAWEFAGGARLDGSARIALNSIQAPFPSEVPTVAEGTEGIEIKIADEELKGRYCNLLRITHTRDEFVLDFIHLVPPAGIVTSRVVTSPGHMKRVLAAMAANVARYEEAHGAIPEAPEGDGDRSVH